MTGNSNQDTSVWSSTIIELLERQHALVEELALLAERQARLIRDAQTEALLALLSSRQRVIEQFTGAQQDLGEVTTDLEARLQTVNAPERERIQTLIGTIGDRLAEVMERDQADQVSLEAARGRARTELASLDASRHARNAYLRSRAVNNRFADQKG